MSGTALHRGARELARLSHPKRATVRRLDRSRARPQWVRSRIVPGMLRARVQALPRSRAGRLHLFGGWAARGIWIEHGSHEARGWSRNRRGDLSNVDLGLRLGEDQCADDLFRKWRATGEQEVQDLIANDPAGKINKYEYFPMKAIVPSK